MNIKNLTYQNKSFWESQNESEIKKAFEFAEEYKKFLDKSKTVRNAVEETEKILLKNNFVNLSEKSPKKSSKIYSISKGKNIAFAVLNAPLSKGVNIIASHIDSPCVHIKQNPLYEDFGLSILKTHYYGGIKKYQWLSTPLSLIGIAFKKNGEKVEINIGEDENDPVLVIPDLLPHLARKVQYEKKLSDAFDANKMNLVLSSMPYLKKEEEEIKEKIKTNVLYLLNKKYGISEEDFFSAELNLVPAGKARDAGLDSSMVLAYGQDDKICSYCAMEALLKAEKSDKTCIVYFADKEEIGSDGNTGAKSKFLEKFIVDLLKYNDEEYDNYSLHNIFFNSQILSADVGAAINPNYPEVHDRQNATIFGYGVELTKFTGGGGKYSTSDANSEFLAKIIRVLNEEKISWQLSTLGKVDEGGGGTIAKFLAASGAEVLDCGTGLLGMHSLYELSSKADLYSTYRAYKIFLEKI